MGLLSGFSIISGVEIIFFLFRSIFSLISEPIIPLQTAQLLQDPTNQRQVSEPFDVNNGGDFMLRKTNWRREWRKFENFTLKIKTIWHGEWSQFTQLFAHLSIDKIFSCRPATWNSMWTLSISNILHKIFDFSEGFSSNSKISLASLTSSDQSSPMSPMAGLLFYGYLFISWCSIPWWLTVPSFRIPIQLFLIDS